MVQQLALASGVVVLRVDNLLDKDSGFSVDDERRRGRLLGGLEGIGVFQYQL